MTKKKNPLLTKSEALKASWKIREDYLGEDRGKGSLHNVWRSKVFTKKGKKIGFPEEWKTYKGFKKEVSVGFKKGMVLVRLDINRPFDKDNFIWVNKGEENMHKCSKLKYNGEEKYLFEWANEYGLNYSGLKQRFYKGKQYTNEEVLFGKTYVKQRKVKDHKELNSKQEVRNKASKMLSQYKLSDRRKGLEYDVDIDYLISVFSKKCIYCDSSERIGLDRKDNNIGHMKYNCVPCCYRCNTTRQNNFTFEEMIKLGVAIKEIDNERIKRITT